MDPDLNKRVSRGLRPLAGLGRAQPSLPSSQAKARRHRLINPQSFNWTMDTRTPLGLLAGVVLALIVASAITAMLAGRSAVSVDAVRAVREDW